MKEMTCITCPNGCHLQIEEKDEKILVTGNRCKRGETFAISELTHPMRTICSTVRTTCREIPVLPVRVTQVQAPAQVRPAVTARFTAPTSKTRPAITSNPTSFLPGRLPGRNLKFSAKEHDDGTRKQTRLL